jgi:RND family efflux transporter MFP subunit
VEVFESQVTRIRKGMAADIQISNLPGQSLVGKVDYIYPYLDPKTRTVRVRIVVPNKDLALRPEMYATVGFQVPAGEPVLAVPNEAILDTGERRIAFVSRGEGTFEPREVTIGLRTRDDSVVLAGLTEGEAVVISGNFLIDSESRLKAALASMGSGAAAGHQHGN